ncbi:amidohydrolase [Paenibacillus sp. N1-5-1-14]|nr:amidohydrolase [Paenibacillus radicibacter]
MMLDIEQMKIQLDDNYAEMVQMRRYLHQNPELSFHEYKTAAFVADTLRGYGLEVRTQVGGNGVVAKLQGELPGPTVALRADMDALPIQDEKKCEYTSKVPGVMHACGHDGHTTSLLFVAKVMSAHRATLQGNIVFIFQHGEELSPGGAVSMIADGALEEVDVIYGVHLWSPVPLGQVTSRPGAFMAAADEFTFHIHGKGGHGGLPHQTVDTIVVGSHLVVNLQSLVARNVDPTQSCVVSIGSFLGGGAFNVIAEKVSINGTTRTFDPQVRLYVKERLKQIAEATCQMFGATCELEYIDGYPPVVNDGSETDRFMRVSESVVGSDNVHTSEQNMAGEDFSYYLQKIPGCYMFVGAGNVEQGIIHPHHHPKFDIDERSMLVSAKLLMSMAMDYIEHHRA